MHFSARGAITALGALLGFLLTYWLLKSHSDFLPRDHGREYAVNGKQSIGKPRGAGIVFVLAAAAMILIFGMVSVEMILYMALLAAIMLTGYLDDAAKVSWGELRKGILDLVIAVATTVVFLYYNGSDVTECFTGGKAHLPMVLFAILSILLIWVAINVTNCSDGVDGLSGTLTIITLLTYYVADQILQKTEFNDAIIIFIACLLAYLWFNAGPSLMLMGDAGSRAMGFFIALTALKSGSPFLYLLASIVLIVDGGAGIAKVFLMRHTKIRILQQTTTPIHDHVRKNFGWSNTQTVTRFAIIQMVVSVVTLGIMMH